MLTIGWSELLSMLFIDAESGDNILCIPSVLEDIAYRQAMIALFFFRRHLIILIQENHAE